jgi:hypothetical protein
MWYLVGSAEAFRRERVGNEARSALGAGEAGAAGHQTGVVYHGATTRPLGGVGRPERYALVK